MYLPSVLGRWLANEISGFYLQNVHHDNIYLTDSCVKMLRNCIAYICHSYLLIILFFTVDILSVIKKYSSKTMD